MERLGQVFGYIGIVKPEKLTGTSGVNRAFYTNLQDLENLEGFVLRLFFAAHFKLFGYVLIMSIYLYRFSTILFVLLRTFN